MPLGILSLDLDCQEDFDDLDGAGAPNVVLGLAVPKDVQRLPRTPPFCYPTEGDSAAVELLRRYGNKRGVKEAEIDRACELASGLSDIVFILQRPSAKTYDTTFDKFVRSSRTLQAIDDLIRFATRGARSIHNVTVLDAFSFQEDKDNHTFDQECHGLLAQIIRTKKPKVIVRCHTEKYKHAWMRRFELPCKEYRLTRELVDVDIDNATAVFQSFHPSVAVNYFKTQPVFRALLIHHILAAFGELQGQGNPPDCTETLRQLCNNMNIPEEPLGFLHSWEYIGLALRKRYEDKVDLGTALQNPDRPTTIENRALVLSNMYWQLRCLAQGTCNPGALTLERIRCFGWHQGIFGDNPLFGQVQWLLQTRGFEQDGWFAPASKLAEAPVPRSISQELEFYEEPLHKVDVKEVLIARIRKQISAVLCWLQSSSTNDLVEALRVASITAYYLEFFRFFDRDGYIFVDNWVGLREDMKFYRLCIDELDRRVMPTIQKAEEDGMAIKSYVMR